MSGVHTFTRAPCASHSSQIASLTSHFASKILPNLDDTHTLVYIPSYYVFLAVRTLLMKREVKFFSLTEYSRWSEVQRTRAYFHHGSKKGLLLMTGRCYFFHRFAVSGVGRCVFVGCPEWEYGEVAGWVEGGY